MHVACSRNTPAVQLKLQYRRMSQSLHVIKHFSRICPQITFDLYRSLWIFMTFRICRQTCTRAFIRQLPLEFSSKTTHYACRASRFKDRNSLTSISQWHLTEMYVIVLIGHIKPLIGRHQIPPRISHPFSIVSSCYRTHSSVIV